jgi:hypothetical protein
VSSGRRESGVKAFPELSPVVLVVNEAGIVLGWVSPRTAAALLQDFRRTMEGVRAEGAEQGDPFPVAYPVPEGWVAEEGMSLEYGHSKVHIPPHVLPESFSEDGFELGDNWDVVLVGGMLGLRWHFTVTPQGEVTARPFLLSDIRLPAHEFGNGQTVIELPRPGPACVALPQLREPLAVIPEGVRLSLGLAVEMTDGASWSQEYTGPFWDYASAVAELVDERRG